MQDRSITLGSSTPWGTADHVEIFDNGIVFASTPSHGGFYVPSHLNAQIPARHRAATFAGRGKEGWYEEDCDWCLVAINFPDVCKNEGERAAARSTFDAWIAPKLNREG